MLSTETSLSAINLFLAPMADKDKDQPKRRRSPLARQQSKQLQEGNKDTPQTPKHITFAVNTLDNLNPSPLLTPDIPDSSIDLDHPLFHSPNSKSYFPAANESENAKTTHLPPPPAPPAAEEERKIDLSKYDSDNSSISSAASNHGDDATSNHDHSVGDADISANVSTSTLALYHQYQHTLVSDPLDSPTSFFSMSSTSTVRPSTGRERPRSMEVHGSIYHNNFEECNDRPSSQSEFIAQHRSSPRRRAAKPVPISVPRPYLHPQAPEAAAAHTPPETITATEFESKFLDFEQPQLMTDSFGVPLSPTTHQLRDIYILVVGAKNSGKSTFIKRCHGLDELPTSGISSRMVIIDEFLWHVRLVETSESMLTGGESYLTWPQSNAGQRVPYIDGVLVLCDVTNKKSANSISTFIECAQRERIPALLVSSKWDLKDDRQLDEDAIQNMAMAANVVAMQSSASSEGHKSCYSTMLYLAVQRKTEKRQKIQLAGRRRAKSSAANSTTTSTSTSTITGTATTGQSTGVAGAEYSIASGRYGHNRSSSEWTSAFKRFTHDSTHLPSSQLHQQHLASDIEPAQPRRTPRSRQVIDAHLLHQPGTQDTTRTYSQDFNPIVARPIYQVSSTPNTPPIEVVTTNPFCRFTNHSRSKSTSFTPERRRPKSMDRRNTSSFMRGDEKEGSSPKRDVVAAATAAAQTQTQTLPQAITTTTITQAPTQETEEAADNQIKYIGVTWDELIERLLAPPMSKADRNFKTVFLCFYRRFAAPRDLLDAILKNFEQLGGFEGKSALLKKNDQLRYCMILFEWVSNYPGDFAHPTTQRIFRNFISTLSSDRTFAGIARDMTNALLRCVRDEDSSWGRVDQDDNRLSVHSFLSMNSMETIPTSSSTLSLKDSLDQTGSSPSSSPNISSTALGSEPSFTSEPQPRIIHLAPGSREQYAAFMECSDADIARELTRIDWELFSKIKPRDFIRHVSFSADEKDKEESLQHINSLISHFNRIAYWVANVVLERSKPKHRARALEKFMNIAWLLRHDNSYNSLGALIAGINGIAVHRLALTRSLVDEKVQRHFISLEMLMGTHKSHFAYRLAWENTHAARIPFIPLHRRDIVSAEQGNRTLMGDGVHINWRKFEVMGDILMLLLQSQNIPYGNLSTNLATEKVVKDAILSLNDEELMLGSQELYERSVQLEPPAAQQEGLKSAKRNWFKR